MSAPRRAILANINELKLDPKVAYTKLNKSGLLVHTKSVDEQKVDTISLKEEIAEKQEIVTKQEIATPTKVETLDEIANLSVETTKDLKEEKINKSFKKKKSS